ncbi:hypothetical protein Gdia_0546 [Gluconacetobacter diazotrophicus PA1 5]|uniref:hypothetical protein n=1 Tax=Gluconacetobacter diazotrophicus TaxID=33996 RepID=UPI000173DA25|nr:hypothetical protein [Gluconacetobacter diazotrophicus]ACI50340.1 hypothetical protein Gdia_0546 [Gluconacetobacter diazotrophicus PA1 5]
MTKPPTAKSEPIEQEKEKTCFVVMPISDPDGYEPGHFKRVYDNLIAPACGFAGFKPIRADDVMHTNMIHLDILNQLLEADLVICDLSSRNPNVMFELGIRQAFDKPVVLIQEEGTPRVFDISPIRCVDYPRSLRYDSVVEIQSKISRYMNETFDAKDSDKSINSIVKLLSISRAAGISKPSGDENHNMMRLIIEEISSIKNIVYKDRERENKEIIMMRNANLDLERRNDFSLQNKISKNKLYSLGDLMRDAGGNLKNDKL